MPQHSLSSGPSRIFTRKPSLASRILSVALLALSLLVTLAGLGTAIYLEHGRDGAVGVTSAAPQASVFRVTAEPSAAPAPSAVAASAIAPASPAFAEPAPVVKSPPPAAPVVESPAAGSSAPLAPSAPPQLAALEATPATPATPAAGESGHYWVEYGVFVGERYARHLQQALAVQGLAASIVPTHAPDGRPLLRVRSMALADYAEAREAAARAERALAIGPLVHRSAGEPMPTQMASAPTSTPGGDQRYWVQFGAFPRAGQAARLKEALGVSGIDTVVSAARATSGRLLYLVRSTPLPDHASAVALAQRGRQAADVDFLVGRSEPRHGAAATPSRLAVGDSKDAPQRP